VPTPPTSLGRRAFLIALGAFVAGVLIDAAWGRLTRRGGVDPDADPPFVIGAWRIHHNVVGYGLVLVGLLAYPVLRVPLGLGMIVGHGLRDRLFWFAERVD